MYSKSVSVSNQDLGVACLNFLVLLIRDQLTPFPCSLLYSRLRLRLYELPARYWRRRHPVFLYVPPSGVSWLVLWQGATPPLTKRASAPAVLLLKAVGALPDTDGEVKSPESRRSLGRRSNGLRVHP